MHQQLYHFTSTVSLFENGSEVKNGIIWVNSPMKHKGYTIYRSSYDDKTLASSGFIIKKDPGVAVVRGIFFTVHRHAYSVIQEVTKVEKGLPLLNGRATTRGFSTKLGSDKWSIICS